ncbi:MAG: aminopeptidase [Marinobacter sp.]
MHHLTNLNDDRMAALMLNELAQRVAYIAGVTAFNKSFTTAVELKGLRRCKICQRCLTNTFELRWVL